MSFLLPMVRYWAERRGSDPALVNETGSQLGWGSLARAVSSEQERLSSLLRDAVRPVAIQARQGIAQTIADLALMEMGIPVIVVPAFFTPAQVVHALAHSGAQAVLRDVGHQLRIEMLPEDPDAAQLPAGTARISYTSGSTGAPRGLCLSGSHLLQVAGAVFNRAGAAHAGRHLALLPPGLLLETVAGVYATLLAGGTLLPWAQSSVGLAMPFSPDFQQMACAIEASRARSVILVPEYLAGLVACLERSGKRMPTLSLVAVGGARVNPELLQRARAVGLPVQQGYGLTECGSVVTLHDGDESSLGSVGTGLGAHRLSLAADGEILVDGPLYLGTVEAPRRPGPFATGDLGSFDTQGRLWIHGRKSNLIVTSYGRNISPEWPESLLAASPAIAQCMVHGDGAASLGALIVPNGPSAAVEAAVARANAALPAYARIDHWRAVQAFTTGEGLLTGNGRLRRSAIASRYLQEESAHVVL